MQKGGAFADAWQRVLWANPGLDYSLKRRTSTVGCDAQAQPDPYSGNPDVGGDSPTPTDFFSSGATARIARSCPTAALRAAA